MILLASESQASAAAASLRECRLSRSASPIFCSARARHSADEKLIGPPILRSFDSVTVTSCASRWFDSRESLTLRRRYSLRAHSSSDSRIPRLILKVRSVDRALRSYRGFPDSLLFPIATSHQCLPQRDRVSNSRKSLFRTLTGFKNRHTTGLTAKRGRCLGQIDRLPPAHWLSAIHTRWRWLLA